jgi:hypothetical protein
MNTGQMLLTALASILLGTTILTVNRNNLQSGTILRQTELGVYAVSLATSYVERASGLNFDENTLTGPVVGPTELSSTLGIDAGEVANHDETFDDFDDFNGLAKKDTVKSVDIFKIEAKVYYVNITADLSTPSGTRGYFKRMDLKVAGSAGRGAFESGQYAGGVDTIKLSYIFSYFY